MRKSVLLGVSLVGSLAACAGPSSSATPAPQVSRVATAGGGEIRMSGPEAATVHVVAFPLEKVWLALPAVFDSIGVPITELDPAKRALGNSAFKIHGRLKGVPLSRYIDCGSSTQIGPNADSYDVTLTLTAELRPATSGGTSVNTTFGAVAKPATFAQQNSQCSSKGVMESRFIDILNAKVKP
jgi:hypothetical protein